MTYVIIHLNIYSELAYPNPKKESFMPDELKFSLNIPKTGIQSIDEQYQKIAIIISDLSDNIENDCVDSQISQIFFRLMHLHSHYFVQEQITLARYNFPNLSEIKKVHKSYLNKIIEYREMTQNKANDFCNEVLDFVSNWASGYFKANQEAVDFLLQHHVK